MYGMTMALWLMALDPMTDSQARSERKTNAMHRGSERFHAVLTELGELHDKKQADYGVEDDPFANVRASEEWGIPAWEGAMIRANDKIRRLQTYARTGKLANEGVEDAFKDLAVYAIIALVLWEEDHTTQLIDPDLAADLLGDIPPYPDIP